MKTKFIIFSQSRSGSTLLRELINSHPSFNCEGELIAFSDGYIKNLSFLRFNRLFPYPFIYYRKSLSKAEFYGFTLFIYHVKYLKYQLYLLNRLGWKIIYLCRKDVVSQTISNVLAGQTNKFHNRGETGGMESLNENFKIPEKDFLIQVNDRIRWHRNEEIILKNVDYIPVIYEDDLQSKDNWQAALNRIFHFLGADEYPVNSNLKKTYQKPYSEIVENYSELMQALKENQLDYLLDWKSRDAFP